jgi:hypothetical protein
VTEAVSLTSSGHYGCLIPKTFRLVLTDQRRILISPSRPSLRSRPLMSPWLSNYALYGSLGFEKNQKLAMWPENRINQLEHIIYSFLCYKMPFALILRLYMLAMLAKCLLGWSMRFHQVPRDTTMNPACGKL